MLFKLFIFFSAVPLIELAILIELGSYIGSTMTVTLIIATGMAGALLAKNQGLYVLRQLQSSIQGIQSPTDPIIDGVLVLIGGLLLLTPGILTDTVGFFILFPLSRQSLRNFFKSIILKRINRKSLHTNPFEEKI